MALAAVAATCAATAAGATTVTQASPLRVALAFDGPADAGFERLAIRGAAAAQRAGLATYEVARPATEGPDPALLDRLATAGNQLVIAVGFRWADDVAAAARRYPGTDFAIVDASTAPGGGSPPPNVRGMLFREDQAGRLAGYLAGLTARHAGQRVVLGAVGGLRIPPVQRYIAGFRTGARAADPGARVIVRYSGTFLQGVGCDRFARRMVAQGAYSVFSVAGACGDDAMRASGAAGRTAIGVDVDQSALGRYVLTSAVKRVDVAVKDTITDRARGRFTAGDVRYGLREGGVGLGRISPMVSQSVRQQVRDLARRMGAPARG